MKRLKPTTLTPVFQQLVPQSRMIATQIDWQDAMIKTVNKKMKQMLMQKRGEYQMYQIQSNPVEDKQLDSIKIVDEDLDQLFVCPTKADSEEQEEESIDSNDEDYYKNDYPEDPSLERSASEERSQSNSSIDIIVQDEEQNQYYKKLLHNLKYKQKRDREGGEMEFDYYDQSFE